MKKLLFLIVMIFLFSCEKEEYSCYRCDTQAKNFTSSIITCEMNDSEARKFEIALRLQAIAMTDSIAVVICNKTGCIQK
jgi:hypothetical protein